MGDAICRVEGLGKRYALGEDSAAYTTLRDVLASRVRIGGRSQKVRKPELWALRGISFELRYGQTLGVIGHNGAGKSTLLKILAGVTHPSEGRAVVRGRVGALLEVGTGFHPELTGRENIFFAGAILGMSSAEVRQRFDEIVEFAQVQRFLDTPFKRYSSGMQMRLAFSVAAHLEPEILVIDEVLSIGDAEFQRRCLGRLESASDQGRAVIFVSHNMQAVRSLCDTTALLRDGQLVEVGPSAQVVARYLSGSRTESEEVSWPAPGLGKERVHLLAMRVRDASGATASVVPSASPVCVEMDVKIDELHPGLCIGFSLERPDAGMVLWTYQTDGPAERWPQLKVGRNVLRCTIPGGLLNGGTHSISPKISLYFTEWILNSGPVLTFEVDLNHPQSPHWQHARLGVVAPLLEWSSLPIGLAK